MAAPFDKVLDSAVAHGQAIMDRLQEAAVRRPSKAKYDWHMVRDLVQVAGSGATLWLLYKQKRIAMPFSIATAAITAGLSVLSIRFDPTQELQPSAEDEQLTEYELLREKIVKAINDCTPTFIGAISTVISSASREVLTKPMNLAPRDPAVPFTIGEHVRNGCSLFATYSLVGHWFEMLFCQLIRLGVLKGDYDRSNTMLWDWWLHPFPAEGIAGLLIAGGLSPLREVLLKCFGGRVVPAIAASFLINQVACTSIDYLMGLIANRNYELWDYRNMPFNFQGQVCLQNSIVYSAAATLIAWIAQPARDRWLRKVPADVANMAFSAMIPPYALLSLTYFV